MKGRQKVFYLVFALWVSWTQASAEQEESPPLNDMLDRMLPGEFINYITSQYPYTLANVGTKNYETTQIPLNPQEQVEEQESTQPPTEKIVYQAIHFPGAMNDPFNLHSLPLAFDPYYGLRPPFNLQNPSNYMLGYSPYPNMSYAPYFPNMYNDPFKTGIYGGYGYGMFGMMSPYNYKPPIVPQAAPDDEYARLSSELERLQKLVKALQEKRLKKQNAPEAAGNAI